MNEIAKYGDMINEIKEVLQSARQNVAQQVNTELLTTYWNIGRIIVEHEQLTMVRPAQFARRCLAFLIGEVKRSHILQIGTGKSLAKFLCQRSGQFF